MELTKKDTKMIQGLSVLAMVCLHLFCRYDYQQLYQPLIFIKGLPLCFYFGQLSDFCVAGFAFCSGYSHAAMFENTDPKSYYKRRLKSLLSLYLNYWLIVCVFAVIGLITKNSTIPGSFTEFLLNFASLKNSYNGAWWYMLVYVIIVFASPLLLTINKKLPRVPAFGLYLGLLVASLYFCYYAGIENPIVTRLLLYAVTVCEYMIGAASRKARIFTCFGKINNKLESKKPLKAVKYTVFLCAYLAMLLFHSLVSGSIALASFLGYAIIVIFHYTKKPAFVERFFLFIGKHSTNIWLTHMFFYTILFENFVFIAKYPLLIFIFMLAITVGISVVLNKVLTLRKYLPILKPAEA